MGVDSVSSDSAARVDTNRQARRAEEKKSDEKREAVSSAAEERQEAPKGDKGNNLSAVA